MTFSRIYRRLELGEGESAVSLVSRLAQRCGCFNSAEFCDAHGARYDDLIIGRNGIIASLAEAADVDHERLRRHSLFKQGGRYVLNGVAMAKSAMQRSSFYACPLCLMNDIRHAAKPSLAAFGRGWWHVPALRTCFKHRMSLVTVPSMRDTRDANDIAHRLRPLLKDLDGLAAGLAQRDPSTLENFVASRLDGRDGTNSFLEGLDIHAVVKTSEIVGAFELFGRDVALRTIGGDDWWRAGGVGFPILAQGPIAIAEWVRGHLVRSRGDVAAGSGTWACFGTFNEWLSHAGPDFEGIRRIFAEAVFSSIPMPAGSTAFGMRLPERRLWSVKAAAHEVRRSCEHLGQLLIDAKLLTEPPDAPYGDLAFPAGKAADLVLEKCRNAVSLSAAMMILGLSRLTVTTLAEGGLLPTQLPRKNKHASYKFWISNVEAFRASVLDTAIRTDDVDRLANLVDLRYALKRYSICPCTIIKGIWAKKITIYCRYSCRDLSQIFIDRRGLLSYRAAMVGSSCAEVAKRLSTDSRTVSALIENRYLISGSTGGIGNLMLFSEESILGFERDFVIESVLAKNLGVHTNVLHRALSEECVKSTRIISSYHRILLDKNYKIKPGCVIYKKCDLRTLSGRIVDMQCKKKKTILGSVGNFAIIF